MIQGNIVDIVNRRIFKGTISIKNGTIDKITEEEINSDIYIIPGFVDSHIHIESSLLLPSEFAKIAVKHGTIAVVADPHEIANVCGISGIKYMFDDSKKSSMKFYFGAPSCVPAIEMDKSGAKISCEDIEYLFENDFSSHLSEVMNYPGIINDEPELMSKIELAKKFGKAIDGHAPELTGSDLEKYIDAGCLTDHECSYYDEAIEKINKGMYIQIRNSSVGESLPEMANLIKETPEKLMFCSDDIHPDKLLEGHINKMVKSAIDWNYDLFDVLSIASKIPKKFYNLDIGLLQIGDKADFVVIDNLSDFNILKTFINGIEVYNYKNKLKENKSINHKIINNFNTEKKNISDFFVPALSKKIKVIAANDNSLITNIAIHYAKVHQNEIISNVEYDILKIANVSRYDNSKPAIAFIKNFGLKSGAIASSISHDSHNIIAIGTNDESLCKVVNAIIDSKGGLCVENGGDLQILELPIAGLMSTHSVEKVAEQYKKLSRTVRIMGTKLTSPFMTLAFMGLMVIPELKLSPNGLFSIDKYGFVSLYED